MVQTVIPGMPVRQTENEVESDIVKFLQKRGWIVDRVQVGTYMTLDGKRHVHIGRKGQPDWRFKRARLGYTEYMEVEVKATGAKPEQPQAEYIAAHATMGFKVCWADSIQMFQQWYFARFAE